MAKKKTMLDLINSQRRLWEINPKTRVKGNEKKDKKKRRNFEKRMVDIYLKDKGPFFFILFKPGFFYN